MLLRYNQNVTALRVGLALDDRFSCECRTPLNAWPDSRREAMASRGHIVNVLVVPSVKRR